MVPLLILVEILISTYYLLNFMGANGNINDLELAKFIELAGEYGIRVHILHGDNWNPAVANMAALPPTGNTI